MPASGAATQREFESQEFWDDLLTFIEAGSVVPVVGPELHTVVTNAQEVPLYRAIAERLLHKYGLRGCEARNTGQNTGNQVILGPHRELHDAVNALIEDGRRRVVDFHRPVYDALRDLVPDGAKIPTALSELAQITDFNLFVTTTFDDLLKRAIDSARPDSGQIQPIAYAPNLPGNRQHDLPELWSPSNPCVFHLFGQASPFSFFAIGEEDVLEYMYNLQTRHGRCPDRMLAKLRECHLLLIGCDFADWLSRFFIRLSNQERLSSSERNTKEFLVGGAAIQDKSLTLFLERYSRNSRLYAGGDAASFVSELLQRWLERRPPSLQTAAAIPVPLPPAGPGNVFVSYARQDIAAAERIHSELKGLGAGVPWIDKLNIDPGDEWEWRISGAIKNCDLFLALVSANTERRREGVFRTEWENALERKKRIFGRFIIPVIIDKEWSGKAGDYETLPEKFYGLDFSHAPAGYIDEHLRNIIKDELRKLRRAGKT